MQSSSTSFCASSSASEIEVGQAPHFFTPRRIIKNGKSALKCFDKITTSKKITTFSDEFADNVHPSEFGKNVGGYKVISITSDSKSYHVALGYIEKNLLTKPLHEITCVDLQNINVCVNLNDEDVPDDYKGKWRPCPIFTYKYPTPQISDEERKIFTGLYNRSNHLKFKLASLIDSGEDNLTAEEWACLSKVADIDYPKHQDIAGLMDEFFAKLKDKIVSNCNPFHIAAFAHMTITRIHPFMEGNGRTARLFMNIILMNYGIQPVICSPKADYTKAVKEGDIALHAFEEYLVSLSHDDEQAGQQDTGSCCLS